MGFEIKDSGERQEFDTGAVRDTQENKAMYSLIPQVPLHRLAVLYTRGGIKYEFFNWAKGMPFSRFVDSIKRHLAAYEAGEKSEDHASAVVFGMFSLMHLEDVIEHVPELAYLNDLQTRIPHNDKMPPAYELMKKYDIKPDEINNDKNTTDTK